MGFLDKAKKLAEQAQTKLDDVQSQINQKQQAPSGPVIHYDQHGRPIPPEETTTPPHGDPLTGESHATASSGPVADPGARPQGDPVTTTPGVPPTEPPS